MERIEVSLFVGPYAFLSNFYPHLPGGVTNEHLFQAAKATNADDREAILAAKNPGQAKRIGKRIELRQGWDDVRDEIMLDLVRIKFMRPDLRDLLLGTGDMELIEGNYWGDTYWGVSRGKGENRLGKILMQVRQEIREEMDSATA